MKILFVQIIAAIAGSERYLADLIPAVMAKGHDCTFLNIYHQANEFLAQRYSQILREKNIKVEELKISTLANPILPFRLKSIIRSGEYDLVSSHLIYADFYLALTKCFFLRNLKLITTKHGYEAKYVNKNGLNSKTGMRGDIYWEVAHFAEKFMNHTIAVSSQLRDFYVEMGITSNDKVTVVHHGIQLQDLDELIVDKSLKYGNPQLTIVGRLATVKGHIYAFEAVQKIHHHYPDLKLVLVGRGEREAELKEKVKEMGIAGKVVFLGHQYNPIAHLFAADIALFPSISEAFGLVLIEAMSVKRVVIAFDVPGPSEVVDNGRTGVLIKPFDTEAYGEAIMKLLEDEEKRDTISEEGYREVIGRYDFKRMVEETERIYKNV